MGLLDGLEKLINEHGSSTILKERIAPANDKYSALDSQNEILRSENETLRLDNEQLKQKNRELEEHIAHILTSQEYFEESGALFKRRLNGEWDFTRGCK